MFSLLAARQAYPARAAAPAPAAPTALPRVFWWYCGAAALLAAGFADFALLAFHFQKTGAVSQAAIPLLYAGAMGANGIGALIFGRLYDRIGVASLAVGVVVSVSALPLGFLAGGEGAVASAICWGLGMGAQDGCLRAGMARVVSMDKRGKAFGTMQGLYGVAWFAGSAVMGLLYGWSRLSMVAFGVTLQLAAAALFFALRRPLAEAEVR
jgi:MFS family permease